MKSIIIVATVLLGLVSCKKEQCTELYVTGTNISDSSSMGDFYVDAFSKREIITNGHGRMGHCSKDPYYNYAYVGYDQSEYMLVSNNENTELQFGQANYVEYRFAEMSSVVVHYNNVNYQNSSDRFKFRLEADNPEYQHLQTAGFVDIYKWGNQSGQQNLVMPVGSYNVVWEVQRTGGMYSGSAPVEIVNSTVAEVTIDY